MHTILKASRTSKTQAKCLEQRRWDNLCYMRENQMMVKAYILTEFEIELLVELMGAEVVRFAIISVLDTLPLFITPV